MESDLTDWVEGSDAALGEGRRSWNHDELDRYQGRSSRCRVIQRYQGASFSKSFVE